MSDKSNKYGYLTDVAQSFGANKGVFNLAEINELVADNKWTSFGQLELIETQTITSTVTTLSLDNIKEDIYNVHFLTITDFIPAIDDRHIAMRFKVNGVTDSGFKYEYAMKRENSGGGSEAKAGNDSKIWLSYNCGNATNERANCFMYIYNAGNSGNYTFVTSMNSQNGLGLDTNFQSAIYDATDVVNGIEFATSGGDISSGKFSIYGLRFS